LDLKIYSESDIYRITEKVREFAESFGFNSYDSNLISLAVSEISTNAYRYANGGVVLIKSTSNGLGLEIVINDHGSGIKNISLAMQDGYSTSEHSLGLGLGAASRLVDEMLFNKNNSSGTSISLIKYLPVPDSFVDIGTVSFPDTREIFNGDGYIVKKYEGDKVFIALLDGAGKGEKAQEAVVKTKKIIAKNYKLSFDLLLRKCDELLRKDHCQRGVELLLMRITPNNSEFAGIGNLSTHIYSYPQVSFPIQNGRLCLSLPENIIIRKFKRPEHFLLILHTDGIVNNNFNSFYDSTKPAQSIAIDIFNRYALSDDDATVIVIKG